MFSLPPLQTLRVFEAAARFQSFTEAAEDLGVTQGAVSQQIKALEERIGVVLFNRAGRTVQATEDGISLARAVREGLGGLEQAIAELRQRRRRDDIIVGVLPGFAVQWLFPRLIRFEQSHPGIRVSVNASSDPAALSASEADIVVTYRADEAVESRTEAEEPLFGEHMFPVCSPAYLEAHGPFEIPADMKNCDLLYDDLPEDRGGRVMRKGAGWGTWLAEAGLSEADFTIRRYTQSNIVVQAAIQGLGVALGRTPLVIDALRNGALVSPCGPVLISPFSYALVTPARGLTNSILDSFRTWLVDEGDELRAMSMSALEDLLTADKAS
jgi:LysR family glycine cleavage system transcriptional activator